MPWNSPPATTSRSGGRSMCCSPAPAVIHCVAPSVITPPPPVVSWCSNAPSIMYVTVSKPRCGCHAVPFASPGAYSTSPIWSSSRNGSAIESSAVGNGRWTMNPSPSSVVSAVTTCATGLHAVPDSGSGGTRGNVSESAVTAGISTVSCTLFYF